MEGRWRAQLPGRSRSMEGKGRARTGRPARNSRCGGRTCRPCLWRYSTAGLARGCRRSRGTRWHAAQDGLEEAEPLDEHVGQYTPLILLQGPSDQEEERSIPGWRTLRPHSGGECCGNPSIGLGTGTWCAEAQKTVHSTVFLQSTEGSGDKLTRSPPSVMSSAPRCSQLVHLLRRVVLGRDRTCCPSHLQNLHGPSPGMPPPDLSELMFSLAVMCRRTRLVMAGVLDMAVSASRSPFAMLIGFALSSALGSSWGTEGGQFTGVCSGDARSNRLDEGKEEHRDRVCHQALQGEPRHAG